MKEESEGEMFLEPWIYGPQTRSNPSLKVLLDSEFVLLVKRGFVQLNFCCHKADGKQPGLITDHLVKVL